MIRNLPLGIWLSSLALAACSKGGASYATEAEALAAQGKLDEAAALFELVCVAEPQRETCLPSRARATEARLKAAEKSIEAGKYTPAERQLYAALITADEAGQKKIEESLASEELLMGLRYERALAAEDKQKAARALEPIAESKTRAAARAKEWLERERPALLVEEVKAACGPKRQGSCTKARAALKARPPQDPLGAEAASLAEAEERRVYPLRLEAERFVAMFAGDGQKRKAYEKCLEEKKDEASGEQATKHLCHEEVLAGDDYDKKKNNENLWRRLMNSIGDAAVVEPLEARKKQAQTEGTFDKQDVPKPAPKKT